MRRMSRAAVLTFGVAAALTVASPSTGAATPDGSAAAATVARLDQGRPALDHLPPDFARVMGYQPVLAGLADGSQRVVNPDGECSLGGQTLPFDFTTACRAHDFGYDMLRYAQRTGSPLPSRAREDIDRLLARDLHTQCLADNTPAACDAMASVVDAAVTFNSWRQVSGPPDYDAGMPRTAGLVLLAGVGTAGLIMLRRRRRGPLPALATG